MARAGRLGVTGVVLIAVALIAIVAAVAGIDLAMADGEQLWRQVLRRDAMPR